MASAVVVQRPAGVVRWTNHSGAAAGDHENEGRRQREEKPGRFAPPCRPCSLAGQSIVEDQARWDQRRRLAGGTLGLQAGIEVEGKGRGDASGQAMNACVFVFT